MATDVKRALRKYVPHPQKAKADNLNEADTGQRRVKVFEEVPEWDGSSNVSSIRKLRPSPSPANYDKWRPDPIGPIGQLHRRSCARSRAGWCR